MKLLIAILLLSPFARASEQYYLDIYDSKSDKKSVEVVFSYKGCEQRLTVNKNQLEDNENISKWLKSLKKSIDSGGGCAN